jgi:hypothetical protein
MPTSAALPATITPHARAQTHDTASPTQHNTTSASWGVSPNTAHTNKPRTVHRTLTYSIQHTTLHARTTSRTAAITAHCANITERTQLRAPHTPPTVTHACTQRSKTQEHEQSTTSTVPRSAAPSHSDAHATTQIRNRNTTAQRPTQCAQDSAGDTRPRRALYIARVTQPRFFTVSQAQRAPRAYADQPRAPRHHHTTHARAICPQAYNTQAPARPVQLRQLRTAPTAHCAIIVRTQPHAYRTQPHARRTQHGTPPTENHTQSHTRPPRHTYVRAFRLPSVDGMLPESWLLLNHNVLQDTRSAIAHHGTRRRHPPQPAARTAFQRIAEQTIKQCQMKACQHTACYRSRTAPCVIGPLTTQPDSPQVPDAVIPPHKPATQ